MNTPQALLVVGGSFFIGVKAFVSVVPSEFPHIFNYDLNIMLILCCRSSLAFRLMPQGNAVLDCSPIAAAGHVIPQSYVPISVSQFMDDLSAEEDVLHTPHENAYVRILST